MRFTLLLSLFRLASILMRSPVLEQRSSVGWIVVRRPSIAVLAFTRSSIELTLASPTGQPKAKPGCSKPFLVAQPAVSARTISAARVHAFLIGVLPCIRCLPEKPGCEYA